MAIKELDPGERHTFALSALRVQLTGNARGAQLRAVDQAGHESVTVRLTPTEIVVTPEPRRLRLIASPTNGASFEAGTSIGLTLLTEGASPVPEQILVAGIDVGALASYELGTLEFATDRTVLTVAGMARSTSPTPVSTSGTRSSATPLRPPDAIDEQAHPWVRAGRYAFRDAAQRSMVDEPPTGWGVVVDGSASMLRLYQSGQLETLLTTTSGIMVQWTSRWASLPVCAGVQQVPLAVPGAAFEPIALLREAFDEGIEPASGARLDAAVSDMGGELGDGGAVLVLTDGVPGDVDSLVLGARSRPETRLIVVVAARSEFGLASELVGFDWWNEELDGFKTLAALPNVVVAALAPTSSGDLDLGPERAAALATSMTARLPAGVGS